MKCEVCGLEIREGTTECPRCKYPVIVSVGDSPELAAERKALAREYAKQLIGDTEAGFIAYSHKVTRDSQGNEKLEMDYEENISFGKILDLAEGETRWNGEGFLHPKTTSLKMSAFTRKGRVMRRKPVEFRIDAGGEDCYIGIMKTDPVSFRLRLRYGATIRESEDICVL